MTVKLNDISGMRLEKLREHGRAALLCLFGLGLSSLSPSQSIAQVPPQDLVLSGIFHRPDGRSSAIFQREDKTQKLIAEGRMVVDGIQLIAIEPHRVKISDAGKEIWLSMTVERSADEKDPVQGSTMQPAQTFAKAQSQIDSQYRRRVIRLKSGLKRQMQNGRSVGYMVRSGDLLDVLHGAGIQPGDIIQSINANAFTRSEDLEDFAYDWRSDGTYRYTVLRGNARIVLE